MSGVKKQNIKDRYKNTYKMHRIRFNSGILD